jgi:hypothetical protein
VTLGGFLLSPSPKAFDMPKSENPVQLVSVSQRYDDHTDPDAHQNKEIEILVMP